MSLWMPLYESSLDTSRSVIATFFQAFPTASSGATARRRRLRRRSVRPARADGDRRPRPEESGWNARTISSGGSRPRPGFRGRRGVPHGEGGGTWEEAIGLLATYPGQRPCCRTGCGCRDDRLSTCGSSTWPACRSENVDIAEGESLLASIIAHSRFPEWTFVGSTESLDALSKALFQEVGGHPLASARYSKLRHYLRGG